MEATASPAQEQEAFVQDLGPHQWPTANFDPAPTPEEWAALEDLACAGAFEEWDGTPAPAPTAHDHVGQMRFDGTTCFCTGCGQVWHLGQRRDGTGWVAEGQEGRVR